MCQLWCHLYANVHQKGDKTSSYANLKFKQCFPVQGKCVKIQPDLHNTIQNIGVGKMFLKHEFIWSNRNHALYYYNLK